MNTRQWRFLALGSLGALVGCATSGDSTPTTGAAAGSPRTALEIATGAAGADLRTPQEREQLGFKKVGDTWIGGNAGYRARVNERGMSLTAYAYDRDHGRAHHRVGPNPDKDRIKQSVVTRFDTASVTRGGQELLGASSTFEPIQTGGLLVHRGAVDELFENTRQGVEESWLFDRAPAGKGDLEIHVAELGQAFVGASNQGIAFHDPMGGPDLVYGQATWIDATGKRTAVYPMWENEQIVLRVPESVLAETTYPAALDPIIGAAGGGSPPETYAASVAYGGGYFLVAWEDYTSSSPRVVVSRVRASDGVAIDPVGVQISAGGAFAAEPAVAFNGTNFVVAWRDNSSGTPHVYTQLVSPSTGAQSGGTTTVTTGSNADYSPSVACNGTNCLVAWHRINGGGKAEVRARRIDGSNLTIGSESLLSAGADDQYATSVGTDGANYLIAWEGVFSAAWDIRGARVASDGSLLQADFGIETSAGDQYSVNVSYAAGSYLVSYVDWQGIDENVYAHLVNAATGAPGAGIPIVTSGGNDASPFATFDGTNYLLSYWVDNNLYAQRLSTAAAAVGGQITVSAAADRQEFPQAAFGGGYHLIAFDDYRTSRWQTYLNRVDTAGTVQDGDGKLLSGQSSTCSSVTLGANPASPQAVGTPVSVSGTTGCSSPEYQFWINRPGLGWSIAQDWSTSSSWNWNTASEAVTSYYLMVRVRRVGSSADFEAYDAAPYTLTNTGECNSVSFVASPSSPSPVGTMVGITGSASCTGGSPEYQFWVNRPGVGWTMERDYGSNTWTWNTANHLELNHAIMVRARRIGSSAEFESYSVQFYLLSGSAGTGDCSAVALSTNVAPPQSVGTQITLIGTPTCSGGATPEYQYWVNRPGVGWSLDQNWTTSNNWIWNTAGHAPLNHALQIRLRAQGKTVDYEAFDWQFYMLQ